jgi:hypothetical protein
MMKRNLGESVLSGWLSHVSDLIKVLTPIFPRCLAESRDG